MTGVQTCALPICIDRLIAKGLDGDMDEINALDNRALRGKIKSAIVKAKRAAK